MKKPIASLKVEAAASVELIGPVLSLQGAPADAAIDCMRKDGIMPVKPAFDDQVAFVQVDHLGSVIITEAKKDTGEVLPPAATSSFSPAVRAEPAESATSEIHAVGPGAETLRQKAIACTYKAARISP